MSTRLDATTLLFLKLTRLDSTQLGLSRYETDSIVLRQVDLTMLWHQRMGHIGEKGLRAMHNKGMVEGFPDCNLEVIFVNIAYMENKMG
jgi:hypothetical protein